ncbi:MAG: dependent pyridine nucleotide-disulfide oxidoreductase protein [Rhodospirillales bacterium]|nr:dependent pyridine nucleotide-disulfide oxidoreductase protein [Rhodospirillales bacterium]
MQDRPDSGRKRVVIVGAGFGGLWCAQGLRKADLDVIIVDRHNYHLFQPLLYQVATAALSPADIAAPIRNIVRDQRNVRVLLDEVTSVDRAARTVQLAVGGPLAYDRLVLATGVRHAYFGHDEWAEFAPGLKTIDDATQIRRQVLLAFERAEIETDPARRTALLTFAVVGAGPTGVELAGAIAELARHAIVRDFRTIRPDSARILLLEAGPRALPSFRESLSDEAARSLRKLGVELRVGAKVEAIDADSVTINGERVPCRTTVWAAGVRASRAATWLDVPCDRNGRVVVDDHLHPPGLEDVYVVGDTAAVAAPEDASYGAFVPGIAPAAKQMGGWVARDIAAWASGSTAPSPFRYKHQGSLATIGRKSAVVDFGFVRMSGFSAWVLWSIAHIFFLIGFRNRLVVAWNWLWQYLTFHRGARLITGNDEKDV